MRRVVGMLMALSLGLAAPMVYGYNTVDGTGMDTGRSPVFTNQAKETTTAPIDKEAWAAATSLPTSRRHFDLGRKLSFGLKADPGDGEVKAVSNAGSSKKKNPGRALLLSAIMPGAGELYAGSKIKAAVFFAAEVGMWYGAVSYAQRGKDRTNSFELFADNHWRENIYRQKEYQAATDGSEGEQYTGTIAEWQGEKWDEKIHYLPDNFTHDLPDTKNQQYYENVGKYMTQFGFGWDDEYGDNPNTRYVWDGTSPHAELYRDMRYQANQLYSKSSTFFKLIMVNHVLSALDAGFSVRSHNRKIAEVEPQVSQINYNSQPVAMAGLRVRF